MKNKSERVACLAREFIINSEDKKLMVEADLVKTHTG